MHKSWKCEVDLSSIRSSVGKLCLALLAHPQKKIEKQFKLFVPECKFAAIFYVDIVDVFAITCSKVIRRLTLVW